MSNNTIGNGGIDPAALAQLLNNPQALEAFKAAASAAASAVVAPPAIAPNALDGGATKKVTGGPSYSGIGSTGPSSLVQAYQFKNAKAQALGEQLQKGGSAVMAELDDYTANIDQAMARIEKFRQDGSANVFMSAVKEMDDLETSLKEIEGIAGEKPGFLKRLFSGKDAKKSIQERVNNILTSTKKTLEKNQHNLGLLIQKTQALRDDQRVLHGRKIERITKREELAAHVLNLNNLLAELKASVAELDPNTSEHAEASLAEDEAKQQLLEAAHRISVLDTDVQRIDSAINSNKEFIETLRNGAAELTKIIASASTELETVAGAAHAGAAAADAIAGALTLLQKVNNANKAKNAIIVSVAKQTTVIDAARTQVLDQLNQRDAHAANMAKAANLIKEKEAVALVNKTIEQAQSGTDQEAKARAIAAKEAYERSYGRAMTDDQALMSQVGAQKQESVVQKGQNLLLSVLSGNKGNG